VNVGFSARAIACALVVASALACGRETAVAPAAVPLSAGSVQILFSPWDDIEGALVSALRGARREILVHSFTFTSRPLARALIEARARGVDVRVTADAGESERVENNRIPDLAAAGIPVFVEDRYQSAHNKVMIIDASLAGGTVITGSFNWTYAAQRRNAENVLIISGQNAVSARYRMNWERHRADARPYTVR
jgi:phosphatidylserine/phosphatidylglycerophosphate/cardiolipin synthase-like enzyme